ncbi:DUF5691 domain-containing protein [Deinococcus deserti]|uniref:Uncharacterized protein n=1 Tax=Deinococcus deserti (strain DSM 17065 / CIP 109153 / LMG 22923 / VCD115) TaxID=546414 RepID=C1CXE3_DEIDV|nr:DUF5691 domain-containing protein [Deinococcus deserti]ACO46860.1 hypothetical protein Deide_18720 [Deinococcus deserti VCD115]
MNDFDALLACALVGTSRASLPVHEGSPLAGLLNTLPGTPEQMLLSRASLAASVRLAGRAVDRAATELPPTAPEETRPEAPACAARHLSLVVGTPLLAEWLQLCAAAGWHVPPASLPELLDRARQDTTLREQLRPVLSERGVWLAAFNPDWRFLAGGKTTAGPDPDAWDEASEAGREGIFRTWRARDPEIARELLRVHFAAERAGTRRRLLSALLDTLEPEDEVLESLLEDALNDRSTDVAHLAREVLRLWPRSALNRRYAAQAQALLPGDLGSRLAAGEDVAVPSVSTPDTDLKRDGLVDAARRDPHSGISLLRALLGAAHPQALLDVLNLSPTQLVGMASQLDALDTLAARTMVARHRPTAQALLPHFPHEPGLLRLGPVTALYAELRLALAGRRADKAYHLLEALPSPWPAELSRDVIRALRDRLNDLSSYSAWDRFWQQLLSLTSLCADPSVPAPDPLPDTAPEIAHRALSELLGTLSLRAQMHADFQQGAKS